MPPQVVVFDVNETLSDMAPLANRFADLGASPALARLWFAALLRDGFARTAAGESERFAVLAESGLRVVLHGIELDRPVNDAVAHVLDGFAALSVHGDVQDGVRALRARGLRLVTMSNGAAAVAEELLGDAGLRGEFEHVLSVEDAGVWKPAPGSYGLCGGGVRGRAWRSSDGRRPPLGSRWGCAGGLTHGVDRPHRRALPRLVPHSRLRRAEPGSTRRRPGLSSPIADLGRSRSNGT